MLPLSTPGGRWRGGERVVLSAAKGRVREPSDHSMLARMTDPASLVSEAFKAFLREAPEHARAWGAMVGRMAEASALDRKTAALAYLAVLAAQRLESGIAFHVQTAKQAGATRDEIISAILIGLPAAGLAVTQVLPAAIAAFDAPQLD